MTMPQPGYAQPAAHAMPAHQSHVPPAPEPKALLALLAIVAVFPILSRFVWMVVPAKTSSDVAQLLGLAMLALEALLIIAAVIPFLMWIHGVFKRLRAAGVHTRYSPGMAVGSWFIPFANFVMPMLAVKEAWCAVTRRGGGTVVLWWLVYLLSTVLRIGLDTIHRMPMSFDSKEEAETIVGMINAAGWVFTLSHIAAFGLWFFIVRTMSQDELRGR